MKFVAKTLYGFEAILAEELESLGADGVVTANRAVLFTGSKELLYRINYCSRYALSVLMPVSDFYIKSKDDLYRKTSQINWAGIMDPDSKFSIVPVINSKLFKHTGYPALVVKDAIADYFRRKSGTRPSVNVKDPDILINLHMSDRHVTISLDSTAEPLYRRGYRMHQGKAPLNEVLAAGIVRLAGWDSSVPLIDPMCGSGTIIIEAGLMANRIPPGKFRESFGFMRWTDYDYNLFGKIKEEADSGIIDSGAEISGSDISEQAVKQAVENIQKAGLAGLIRVRKADFSEAGEHGAHGFLVCNPPYGQRLKEINTAAVYSMIGTVLKHRFAGWKAWILTSGKENLNMIGLKPGSRYTLYNGAIECILAGYSLYEGSGKKVETGNTKSS